MKINKNEEMEKFIGKKTHTISFRMTTTDIGQLLEGKLKTITIHGIEFTVQRKIS